jgi:threonine dehydratase
MAGELTDTGISLRRIEEAVGVIDPIFRNSPQVTFDALNAHVGMDLVLKIETLNPIRCFKGRGTDYFVGRLQDQTPLVTASAGNFGQGMAYAARKRGIRLTVFAATTANELKLTRMRQLGADVILAGHDFDAAKAAASRYAAQMGWRFVEDGRDTAISEGAGTIAVELARWPERLDAVVVPVGNGAMINGIGTWMKTHSPGTQVVGVCAAGAPSMERSWRSGRVETTETAATIAVGIAVRVPVAQALQAMRATVDDMVLVEDSSVLQAMQLLLAETGVLVEPAGAAGVAAILDQRRRFAGQMVATILCGGNVTAEQFERWFGAR